MESQNDVKISIVMPVYNTAPYLRQCLDSVLTQTLEEFELICVDDGSTDGSLEILQQYAEKDSRIIVKHQENLGPAIARNSALSIARGKYIAFMDGDDLYPENNTLEKLFNAAEQSGCKIAGGYRLILKNDGSISEEEEEVYKYIKNILPNGGKVKYSELQTYFNYQCYIYLREFLETNGITFPNYRRFQDPPFFVKAMVTAGEIYLTPSPTYTYRWGNKIAWGNIRTKEDVLLGHIDVLQLAHDYNLDTLYNNTLNRLVHGYTGNIFKDFSLDLAYIYTLYIEIFTMAPPAALTENADNAAKQMLTAAENEIIKAFKNLSDDDIILFTCKTLEECFKKNSGKIYCAAATSLFRVAGKLKSTIATAMRLKITENYINSPYYNTKEGNKTVTADGSQLKAALIWYEQYKKIEKHNAELINKKTDEPAIAQNEIKASIILPVYNTAPYLRQCLDSILAQTFKEFELICVDDGSTDGSAGILEEYAEKDNRISIITQENQGLGRSRNNGLKVAKGEYIIFLDSDDVFSDVLLEHTYNAGIDKKADIVLFDILHYDHNTKKPLQATLVHDMIPENEIFSWCDIPEDIFSVAPPNTCSGIYRREFLLEHNLQFQDLPNAEDVYFTFYARVLAERITIVDEPLYYYRKNRPGSIETETKNDNSICFLKAFYALYSDLVKIGLYEPLKKGFQCRFLNTLIYNLNSVKTTKARLEILQALDEEPYCNLPIDDEITGDEKDRDVLHYKKVKAARKWYHKNLRIDHLGAELKNAKTAPPIEEQGTVTVSVVIPVYNTEKYLREALDSIVNQTLKDIEIICVNDGSTDGSAKILEEYAKKDNRISIITQENKGQSCARNAGIMAARGKYIYFMDSDDILETTALEESIQIMEGKDLDVMCFDGEAFAENPELMTPYFKTAYKRSRAYNDVYDGAELLKLFRKENKYSPVVWLQIYKASFLRNNDIYFIPGILHEDDAFIFSTFLNSRRTSHVNRIYFHRRLHENSIMTSDISFDNVYGKYTSYHDMIKTYYMCLPNITNTDTSYSALQIIYLQLSSVQSAYRKLSEDEIGSELGITNDIFIFTTLVGNETGLREQLESTKENLKKQQARSDRLYRTSEKNRIRKEELNEKLKKSRQQNEELKEKLKISRQQNEELKEKAKNTRQRKNELKGKLDNSKQRNSELKEKLDNSKKKNGELKEKLANTKQSNSELKKKLKKCKKENEALRKKLKEARAENKKIKNSRAYKLSRLIMYIPHRIKRLFKK